MPGSVAVVKFRFLIGSPEAGVTSDPELPFDYHFSCLIKRVFVILWGTGNIKKTSAVSTMVIPLCYIMPQKALNEPSIDEGDIWKNRIPKEAFLSFQFTSSARAAVYEKYVIPVL